MKRILLSMLIVLSINVSGQKDGRNKLLLKVLRDGTNGDEWHFKTHQDLLNRTTSPRIIVRSGEVDQDFHPGAVPAYFQMLDLSNNNIKGALPNFNKAESYVNDAGETVTLKFQGLFGTQRVDQGVIFSHNEITSVDISDINRTHFRLHSHLPILKLDNNKLTEFSLINHDKRGGLGVGMEVLWLHQNEISSLNTSHFPMNPNAPYDGVFSNQMKEFRVDNNRLNFSELIDLHYWTTKVLTIRYGTLPGNPDFKIDYYPQKPLGGDATEETKKADENFSMSFSLPHAKNQYQWQLNGKDIPGANTKEYSVFMSDVTAGIWRCKVTNPDLPDAELFSYDMAYFMEKDGNKTLEDFKFISVAVTPNFPKAVIVGDFQGTDPDGDELYYRLPDKTADNSHFRIKNGRTLVSAETLFEREYIEEYKIQVEAYDIYGGKKLKEFTIKKGEATGTPFPTDVTISNNTLNENELIEIATLTIEGVKPEYGYKLTLPAGMSDNDFFSIEGDKLKNNAPFDYEKKKEYTIRTKSVATDGTSFSKTFLIKVTDVNDAPHELVLSNNRFEINNNLGDLVGYLNAVDQDPTDRVFSYSLVDGFGDNAAFLIEYNSLKVKKRYTKSTSLSVKVDVADAKGAKFTKEFTIIAYNKDSGTNNPPSAIGLSNTTVNATYKPGDAVSSIYLSDPEGDKGTFSIKANAYFDVKGAQLILKKLPAAGESFEIEITGDDEKNTITRKFKMYMAGVVANANGIGLSNNVVLTDVQAGGKIADVVVGGADANACTYTLNSDYLELVGSELKLKSRPDESTLNIEVTANDGKNGVKQTFTIYFAIEIDNTNYVENVKQGQISFYPNPTRDVLHVSKPGLLKLYNSTGKFLMKQDVIDQINISQLEAGIYFVLMQADGIYYQQKIVKQ